MNTQTNNYNDEPVHYCKYCLSLDNPEVLGDIEYCKYCGSTEFEDSHIDDWERQFEKKYKQGKFLKINYKQKDFINIKKGEKWKKIMQSTNNTMML